MLSQNELFDQENLSESGENNPPPPNNKQVSTPELSETKFQCLFNINERVGSAEKLGDQNVIGGSGSNSEPIKIKRKTTIESALESSLLASQAEVSPGHSPGLVPLTLEMNTNDSFNNHMLNNFNIVATSANINLTTGTNKNTNNKNVNKNINNEQDELQNNEQSPVLRRLRSRVIKPQNPSKIKRKNC